MEPTTLDRIIVDCSDGLPLSSIFADEAVTVAHDEFCRAFAQRVAAQYFAGAINFRIANAAMNRLFEYCYGDVDRGMPAIAHGVYDAFDAGEYRHAGDAPDVDPELRYTRPRVAAILAAMSVLPSTIEF
jgi:hypothetical protein